jgi:hypothetical protein
MQTNSRNCIWWSCTHICLVCFARTIKVERLGQWNLYCYIDTCEPCKIFRQRFERAQNIFLQLLLVHITSSSHCSD